MSPEQVKDALRLMAQEEVRKEMSRVLTWFANTCDVAERRHPEAAAGLRVVRGVMENFKLFYGGVPQDPPPVQAIVKEQTLKLNTQPKQHRRFTDEEREYIIKAHAAGVSPKELAKKFERTEAVIRQLLIRQGELKVKDSMGPPVKEHTKLLFIDYGNGADPRSLAEKYGLTLTAVYRAIARQRKAAEKVQGRPLEAAE